MAGDQQRSDSTADGRVEREDDEVALIVEADTRRREEAVVVALQHAAVADLAVMRARRSQQQTHRARLKSGRLIVSVALARGSHHAASVEGLPYSLASRL